MIRLYFIWPAKLRSLLYSWRYYLFGVKFFLYLVGYYGFSRSTYFELILKIRRVVKDVRNATLLRRIDSNFKILKKTSKERIIRTFSCEKRVCAKRVDLKENIIYRTAFVESQIINFLQVIREHFPAKQNSFGEWNFFIPHFVLALQSCNHALTLNPKLITEQEPNHSQKMKQS